MKKPSTQLKLEQRAALAKQAAAKCAFQAVMTALLSQAVKTESCMQALSGSLDLYLWVLVSTAIGDVVLSH